MLRQSRAMAFVVTIDGPAGSGKSTVARHLAKKLSLPYIDTGSMYRAVAFEGKKAGVSLENESELVALARTLQFRFVLSGEDFEIYCQRGSEPEHVLGAEIRTPELSLGASQVAKHPKLRAVLVEKQQEIGAKEGGVAEGRDAGTVIFPQAPVKFFLTASPEVRARRRQEELVKRQGDQARSYEEVLRDVNLRDQQDASRAASPMIPAKDAQLIDTSEMNIDEVLETLYEFAQNRWNQG